MPSNSTPLNKIKVHSQAQQFVRAKITDLQNQILQNKDNLNAASKSTAGDKHDTARAMMHLEEEKIALQIQRLQQFEKLLHKINPKSECEIIGLGSLILTNKGWLYISAAIGSIELNGQKVMLISLASPVGKSLKDEKVGFVTRINSQEWKVLEVY